MCLKDPNLIIRTCAAEALLVLHDPNLISKWGPESTMIESFWSISSTVLIDISRQILDYKERDEGIRYFAEVLLQLLIRRIEFLQLHKDEIHKGLNIKERATSLVAVEIALLVLLCSPDAEICTMATNSFGQLCIECTLTQQYIDTSSSSVTFADNLEVYRELVHAGVLVTGKVAQQKSIRKTLRLIQKQTPGNLAAWEEVYKRWKALKSVATRSPEEAPVDFFEPVVKKKNNFFKSNHTPTQGSAVVQQDNREELVEWQNYTGFLCSLGGCCAIDDSKNPNHDSGKDHGNGQDTMKSKQIGNDSSSMVNRFISEMVELLLCDNALARETVKELLGSELSPILYGALFRHLEEIISKFFGSEGEVICNNNYTMFVEQAISVLKLILDRLQDNAEYLFTVDLDMGNLLLSFARYLHNLGTGSTALRVKVKMCQLTEVLMQKREIVSLRQEFQFRNKMLRILSEWTSDFNSNTSNPQYDEQSEKLHRDLDLSCMKTVVLLLDGLPLQPEDTKNEVDRQQAKSRLFYTYFSNFLKLLNRCRVLESLETGAHSLSENADVQMLLSKSKESFKDLGPLKDYTILALSNLLSANIESGLKYSLSMGYHEDTKTRSAFMQVLTNILKQGTEFESLAESSVNDRFKKIIAVLCDSNLSITTSLCDVCPVQDVDDLGTVLLNVFDSCNMTAPLLKAVIEREIAKTESSPELFRRNSMATRLLASFAKLYGDQYLRVTLQPLLIEMTTTKKSYEVDPSKLGPSSDAEANLQNLKEMCQKFLDSIIESTNLMPASLREICNYLSTVVVKKFPEANTTSVGGLIYLRFFCPALVAPDIHGLVDMITDKEVRRGLLLITKVIQNLANNVLFGAKEAFMISLNDLLNSYIPKVTKYLEDISAPLPINTNVVGGLVSKLSETDLNKLHHYLVDNIERIGRDIATRKSHSPYPLTQPIDQPAEVEKCRASAKVFYYKMSTLLAQLGPPVDLKKKREMMGINSKNANTNEAFRAFMDKHRYRNINPIKDKKIFYEGGYTREGKPLFYYIARRMIAESLDIESVMVYILQVSVFARFTFNIILILII
jgi:neurofibromin 1